MSILCLTRLFLMPILANIRSYSNQTNLTCENTAKCQCIEWPCAIGWHFPIHCLSFSHSLILTVSNSPPFSTWTTVCYFTFQYSIQWCYQTCTMATWESDSIWLDWVDLFDPVNETSWTRNAFSTCIQACLSFPTLTWPTSDHCLLCYFSMLYSMMLLSWMGWWKHNFTFFSTFWHGE